MSRTGSEKLIGMPGYEMGFDRFCTNDRLVRCYLGESVYFKILNFPKDCPTVGQLIDIVREQPSMLIKKNLNQVCVGFSYSDPHEKDKEMFIYLASSSNKLPNNAIFKTTLGALICNAIDGVRPWVWHARRVLGYNTQEQKVCLAI